MGRTLRRAVQLASCNTASGDDAYGRMESALKREKAPGPDGLYPALFREGGKFLVSHLTKLIGTIWDEEANELVRLASVLAKTSVRQPQALRKQSSKHDEQQFSWSPAASNPESWPSIERWAVGMDPPSVSGVSECTTLLKHHHAAGPDDLPPALFKDGGGLLSQCRSSRFHL
ncbi:hypothetical protein T265_01431 [Opisthorchis viverrini]|uniref:Uncharacterized protein n=1 Tax=Opisthorchis viverrini TaxID=6198 RepID=A0A075A2S5_OPIVI|nr:hypothetical protein T265_01431 [Opisthorchis viverrini]KER32557.1 hypothetical protein T265_01431 [Opisthorchis viverrini]